VPLSARAGRARRPAGGERDDDVRRMDMCGPWLCDALGFASSNRRAREQAGDRDILVDLFPVQPDTAHSTFSRCAGVALRRRGNHANARRSAAVGQVDPHRVLVKTDGGRRNGHGLGCSRIERQRNPGRRLRLCENPGFRSAQSGLRCPATVHEHPACSRTYRTSCRSHSAQREVAAFAQASPRSLGGASPVSPTRPAWRGLGVGPVERVELRRGRELCLGSTLSAVAPRR